MSATTPSTTALARARELCEWEQIMWAVLWDTQPDNEPRVRHLCQRALHRSEQREWPWTEHPALFATKRQALAYIREHFSFCLEERYRKRPHNNRMPKPYRVRVRITIPEEGGQ
jgi:hypothetical protein